MNCKFIECIRDSFFEQHLTEPAQGRGTDNPFLDLALTDNSDFVDNVSVKAPLGKRDHGIIEVVLPNHPSLPSYTEIWDYKDFINYNFLYTRFHTRKTVLGAYPCMWEIIHVKE